jgi:hypothetical protein
MATPNKKTPKPKPTETDDTGTQWKDGNKDQTTDSKVKFTVILKGWGPLQDDGTYGDLGVDNVAKLNAIFDSKLAQRDKNLLDWMTSIGAGNNASYARQYWIDAVTYVSSLAKNEDEIDFFKVTNSKLFKNVYLDVPRKYTNGTGANDPQTYITLTDEDTARKDLADEMFNVSGRKPTEKEYKQYYNALNKAQNKNPTVVVNGITTQSRFDEQDFLLRFVAKKLDFADIKPGEGRSAINKVDLYGKEYGVEGNLSNGQRRKLARQILLGNLTDEALMQKMAGIARNAFPAFADKISETETLRQSMADYVGTYANLLELNDNNVSLKDVLGKATSNINGEYKTLSLFDYEKAVRKDPKYQYTKNAHEEAAAFGKSFARAMGVNL